MGKPTPGEWIAIKGSDEDTERWGIYTDGSKHYHIATIENGALGDTLDTEEANARLIASSKDLLEALEHCVKVFQSMSARGAYPQELLPFDLHNQLTESPLFLGKQGFNFASSAIEKART